MTEVETDRAKRITYVIQALQLDPTRHSEGIITARAVALGLAAAEQTQSTVDFQESHRLRQQATITLSNLRTNVWNLPENELYAELEHFGAFGLTELIPIISRLQIIARHRQAFLDLSAQCNANLKLIEMLKDVFALAPRETAELKEGIRLAFRRPIWRRVQRQFLLELRDQIPKLWQLEERWLSSLLHQKSFWLPPRKNHASVRKFAVSTRKPIVDDEPTPPLNSKVRSIWLWATPLYIIVLYLIQAYYASLK